MLNGKFFTGLPPKMIDRRGVAQNRLESHFFWPDDSQTNTAVETKIKRRNSVQFQANERPQYEKQLSRDQADADTKKRFSREFSQSSIQFHDNLNDGRSTRRGSILRNAAGSKKTDIAEKPNNTKLELPQSVVDEAYTTAKKNQAYTSTIQFYDYVNEEEPKNNRNYLRKPKMDMNNKREMELNTKNSPKLQIKSDVRSLSEEKDTRKINNRDVKALDKSKDIKQVNVNKYYDKREPEIYDSVTEELFLQNRSSVQPRTNLSPKRSLKKANYERGSGKAVENNYIHFENPEELVDYRRESVEPEFYANRKIAQGHFDNSDDYQYRRVQPNRILRNNAAAKYEPRDDYQEEQITDRMRTVRLKSPPSKHYYQPEEYYDDEADRYYRTNKVEVAQPAIRGSYQRQSDIGSVEVDLPYENVNNHKKLNNQIHVVKVDRPSSPPAEAETTNALKPQSHLRSSLCFHDGAIIAENDATRSPTSQYPTQRRNVRSLATQRVSVGLPE